MSCGSDQEKTLFFFVNLLNYPFKFCRDCQAWSTALDLESSYVGIRGIEAHSLHHLILIIYKPFIIYFQEV